MMNVRHRKYCPNSDLSLCHLPSIYKALVLQTAGMQHVWTEGDPKGKSECSCTGHCDVWNVALAARESLMKD
jgi:hypothetical protein